MAFFPVPYTVLTKTGTYENSETDDDIYISICGTGCSLDFTLLDNPTRDDFKRGQLDKFTVYSRHLESVSQSVKFSRYVESNNSEEVNLKQPF